MAINSENDAREAMANVDGALVDQFGTLIRCLSETLKPEDWEKFGAKSLTDHAKSYAKSRRVKPPGASRTKSDPLVSLVLNIYFEIPAEKLETIAAEHKYSMQAENMVGDLLERYIASVTEPLGWIWCSGSTVKAADFIKKHGNDGWTLLQVKNRDNSENSSSKAIRDGTDIKHWFRTFSQTGAKNWEEFPEPGASEYLSEQGFVNFASNYLTELKAFT